MSRRTKEKPRQSAVTESQGRKSGTNRINGKDTIKEQLEHWGDWVKPLGSIDMQGFFRLINTPGPDHYNRDVSIDFEIERDNVSNLFHMLIRNYFHNCTCHKVAALCFFEWDGKEYKQVPLFEGLPETRHITLGEIVEVSEG